MMLRLSRFYSQILIISVISFGIVGWCSVDTKKPVAVKDNITVVAALVNPKRAAPITVTPSSVQTEKVPLADLIAQALRKYPILKDVNVNCEFDGCQILANLPPPETVDGEIERQNMLQGGLASIFYVGGYTIGPEIQLDEVGDNDYVVRIFLPPYADVKNAVL